MISIYYISFEKIILKITKRPSYPTIYGPKNPSVCSGNMINLLPNKIKEGSFAFLLLSSISCWDA